MRMSRPPQMSKAASADLLPAPQAGNEFPIRATAGFTSCPEYCYPIEGTPGSVGQRAKPALFHRTPAFGASSAGFVLSQRASTDRLIQEHLRARYGTIAVSLDAVLRNSDRSYRARILLS
jgi:hypothetical protein